MSVAAREYTGQEEFDGESDLASKLTTAGLVVVSTRLIETGGEIFYWIVARKPVAQAGVPPTMMLGPP